MFEPLLSRIPRTSRTPVQRSIDAGFSFRRDRGHPSHHAHQVADTQPTNRLSATQVRHQTRHSLCDTKDTEGEALATGRCQREPRHHTNPRLSWLCCAWAPQRNSFDPVGFSARRQASNSSLRDRVQRLGDLGKSDTCDW